MTFSVAVDYERRRTVSINFLSEIGWIDLVNSCDRLEQYAKEREKEKGGEET